MGIMDGAALLQLLILLHDAAVTYQTCRHNTRATARVAASATRWSRSSGSWMAMSAAAYGRDASDRQKDTDCLVLLQIG